MSDATKEVPDPTNCDRCRASLERGWSERWCDGKRVEAVCFGCNDSEQLREYLDTSVLTSSFMTRATIESVRREYGKEAPRAATRQRRDIARRPSGRGRRCARRVGPNVVGEALARAWESTQAVSRAAKDFERVVWFGGLAEQVRAAEHRGLRAAFEIAGEKHKVLAWSCAGRVVFTIEPDDESRQISVICAEDEDRPTMGIQGICATEQQAIAMLAGACAAWTGGTRFERDDKVGMF